MTISQYNEEDQEWLLERAAILEYMFNMTRKQAEDEAEARYVCEILDKHL